MAIERLKMCSDCDSDCLHIEDKQSCYEYDLSTGWCPYLVKPREEIQEKEKAAV